MNSFTVSDDHLYCLTTGKAASDDVRNDLLQVMEKGTLWHEEFLSQCKENPKRFEQPIKRRKVRNFAHDALKMKIGAKDQKIKEIRCTRDLFGRLLYLAATQNVDLGIVLSYPLTPVPLSLCHLNGAMHKTSKCALMDKLEPMGTTDVQPDTSSDVCLIDTMFFLRTLPSLPASFH